MRPRGRRLTEAQERKLVRRGGALAAIAQHPSWPELVEEIREKEERVRKSSLAQALSPRPVSQRQLDYNRGLIDGMNYLLALPAGAEHRLEEYLKLHAVEEGVGT